MTNFFEKADKDNNEYALIIVGPEFNAGNFNPLARIYSAVRKVFRNCYDIDVVGTFHYVDVKTTVCKFFLNCASYETKEEVEKATEEFNKIFHYLMISFEDAITDFENDSEYNLEKYNEIAQTGDFETENTFLEQFLFKHNFKKPKKKSQKKSQKT